MLNSFFIRPLEMNIGGQYYKFCSTIDFEFALQGRTSVPSKKVIELLSHSHDALKKEAFAIQGIEKSLDEILFRSIDSPNTIKRALTGCDFNIFSNDHGWRSIFISLMETGGDPRDVMLRMALYKYIQYLQSRMEIIKNRYPQVDQTYKLQKAAC